MKICIAGRNNLAVEITEYLIKVIKIDLKDLYIVVSQHDNGQDGWQRSFLKFAKTLLPHAKRIGLLYATTDANDLSLVKMMQAAAKQFDMEVVLVPVEHPNEVKLRMQAFKNKVDFIYVGVSGPIQPSLPTIAASASRMHIPVFNADSDAVKSHQVLGSYGVSYYQVGVNTADIVFEILQGKAINLIAPRYPQLTDHAGYISTVVA